MYFLYIWPIWMTYLYVLGDHEILESWLIREDEATNDWIDYMWSYKSTGHLVSSSQIRSPSQLVYIYKEREGEKELYKEIKKTVPFM